MPFNFKSTKSNRKENHLFNYLISLVNNVENNQDRSKLAAIEFARIVTFSETQKSEEIFSNKLERLVEKIKRSKKFPVNFDFSFYKFKILENDVSYINYLLIVSCIYRNYTKEIRLIDIDKIRAFYFSYDWGLKYPKSIFYYQNIRAVGIHKATKIKNDSWILKPSANKGHFCTHYRLKQEKFYRSSKPIEPIRNLNIDFEYLTFILKDYTNFCLSSFN
jgi:hypothetical protein